MVDGNLFVFLAQTASSGPSIELWLAAAGAIFGGAGVKGIERWLSRTETKTSLEAALRNELRDDKAGLRAENIRLEADRVRLEADRNAWMAKYYDMLERFLTLQDLKRDELLDYQKDRPHGADDDTQAE